MKNIIICDAGKPDETTGLCRKYRLGIEMQSFFPPESLDDQELISRTEAVIEGINFRSIHGAFIDLCPGSEDREIRKITIPKRNRIAKKILIDFSPRRQDAKK